MKKFILPVVLTAVIAGVAMVVLAQVLCWDVTVCVDCELAPPPCQYPGGWTIHYEHVTYPQNCNGTGGPTDYLGYANVCPPSGVLCEGGYYDMWATKGADISEVERVAYGETDTIRLCVLPK